RRPGSAPVLRSSAARWCSDTWRRSPAPARSASTSSPARGASARGGSSPASTSRPSSTRAGSRRTSGRGCCERPTGGRRMSVEVYLDHAATSWPKPAVVLEAIKDFLENAGGNTGRAGHRRSIASSRAVSLARERLADLLGAGTPDELVFTKNATE